MNFTEIPETASVSDFTETPKTEKDEFTNNEKMAIGLSLLGGVIFGIVIARDTRTEYIRHLSIWLVKDSEFLVVLDFF